MLMFRILQHPHPPPQTLPRVGNIQHALPRIPPSFTYLPRSCAEKYKDAIRVFHAPYLYSNVVSSPVQPTLYPSTSHHTSSHPILSYPILYSTLQKYFPSSDPIQRRWYNTTYALYGSMILLHLILSNYPSLPDDDLLEDVEKSLEIFESMDDIIVARRCAEMLREVLDVARTCLTRRRRRENGDVGLVDGRGSGQIGTGCESRSGYGVQEVSDGCTLAGTGSFVPGSLASASSGTSLPGMGMGVDVQPGYDGAPTLSIENTASGHSERSNDEDFFFSLFSQNPHQAPDRTRTEMLANLVDPSILEDFAFGGQDLSFF